MLYHTNEIVFTLPPSLKDRSVNMFSTILDGPSEFSLVITRDYLDDGEGIAAYSQRQIKKMGETFPKFNLLKCLDMSIDGEEGVQAEYRWETQGKIMHNQQVVLASRRSTSTRNMVLIMTATAEGNLSPQWEAIFNDVIASIKMRPGQ